MTDDLRTRIAAVICGMDALHAEQWSLDVADAVIRELGDLIAPQYHCIMPDGTHFYPQRTVDD